jgi:hypothetical protein
MTKLRVRVRVRVRVTLRSSMATFKYLVETSQKTLMCGCHLQYYLYALGNVKMTPTVSL